MDDYGLDLELSKTPDNGITLVSGLTYQGEPVPFEVDVVPLTGDEVKWLMRELEGLDSKPIGYTVAYREEG